MGTDLLGKPARGAYVVDGGDHEVQVAECVASGVSYGVAKRSCTTLEATVTIGEVGETYIVL